MRSAIIYFDLINCEDMMYFVNVIYTSRLKGETIKNVGGKSFKAKSSIQTLLDSSMLGVVGIIREGYQRSDKLDV